MNCAGIAPPTTSSTNSKPWPRRQRLDAQVHLAELAGAAGLLLVAVMALGRTRDRLAIRDARRVRLALRRRSARVMRSSMHAQVQLAHAVEHGLVQARRDARRARTDPRRRACAGRRRASARRRAARARWPGRASPAGKRSTSGDSGLRRASRAARRRSAARRPSRRRRCRRESPAGSPTWSLPCSWNRCATLKGLRASPTNSCAPRAHRALVHAEDAELADEGVDAHLEHVRDRRARSDRARPARARRSGPSPFRNGRRVALRRIRHQPREDVEQLRDAGAGLGGDEAHRHQVALAQRLLERVVQLLRRQLLALLEVQRHQFLVDLDHLVDDLRCARLRPWRSRRFAAPGVEEAVDDARAAVAQAG